MYLSMLSPTGFSTSVGSMQRVLAVDVVLGAASTFTRCFTMTSYDRLVLCRPYTRLIQSSIHQSLSRMGG